MSRVFKVIGRDVKSARDPSQLDSPHARLAILLEDDGASVERALARAYSLGRQDMRADIRRVLNEP